MKLSTHALSGVLFSWGLVISGMTQPSKVIGFLDVFGKWDPSLAFVMAGAIAVHFFAYRVVLKLPEPVFAGEFLIPEANTVDKRLVGGAALFGVGWGLSGYCPGPAVVSLVGLSSVTFIFVGAMLVSMLAYGRLTRPERKFAASTNIPMP